MNIQIGSKSRTDKYDKRMKQCNYRSDLHFSGFDFVTHKFRCTSNHQSTDENCYNNECKIIHPTDSNTTKPCINLHIKHFNHTRKKHCGIVHAVYRTIRCNSRDHTPKACCPGTKANFLSFHRSTILSYTHCVNSWITAHFLRYIDTYPYKESSQHNTIYTISQSLTVYIETKCKYHCHRDHKNGAAFSHVRQIGRIFQRMGRVHAIISTTVSTYLFDGNNSCSRSL